MQSYTPYIIFVRRHQPTDSGTSYPVVPKGESPTYILNEDTHPGIRGIGVSHTACKIQVSAKCSISQLEGIFIFMIMFHGYNGRVRAQPLVTFGGTFRRRGGSTSPRGGASTTLIPHHLERRTGPKIHPYSRSCAMDARIVIDRENRTAGSFIISIPAHTVIAAAAAAAAAAALWGRGGLSVVPGVTYAERSSCMT